MRNTNVKHNFPLFLQGDYNSQSFFLWVTLYHHIDSIAEEYSHAGTGCLALCRELLTDSTPSRRRCSLHQEEAHSFFPEAISSVVCPDGSLLYTYIARQLRRPSAPPLA